MLFLIQTVRQMVMFSATWPLAVDQLAREFMDPNPVKVYLKHLFELLNNVVDLFRMNHKFQVVVGSEDLSANHDVMQIVEVFSCTIVQFLIVTMVLSYKVLKLLLCLFHTVL